MVLVFRYYIDLCHFIELLFNLPSKESVDQLLTQKVISMIFASIFGLIDLFVFKNRV